MIGFVEDNDLMGRFLLDVAVESGVEARWFPTAEEALVTVHGGFRPKAMFIDLNLPRMNGIDLAIELKKIAPNVKLLAMTGVMPSVTSPRYQTAADFEEMLLKPFRVGELQEIIRRYDT